MKQGGWKTLERKWDGKLFWSVFSWIGRKVNKWWRLNIFSSSPPKCFLLKMERKLSENEFFLDWQKCPCACAHGLPLNFFFSSPLGNNVALLPSFFFFLFSVFRFFFFFFGGQSCLFFFFFCFDFLGLAPFFPPLLGSNVALLFFLFLFFLVLLIF